MPLLRAQISFIQRFVRKNPRPLSPSNEKRCEKLGFQQEKTDNAKTAGKGDTQPAGSTAIPSNVSLSDVAT